MASAVASRFARAVVDMVTAPGSSVQPEAAVTQLQAFQALLAESADLRNILLSPAVSAPKKKAVVGRLAVTLAMAPAMKNFLFVLVDRRRVADLSDILVSIRQQLDERLGVVRAAITSALPLEPAQQSEVQAALAKLTGKQVHGEFRVDPDLLGGIVARVGSRVYDGSVRGRLAALKGQLEQR